MAGENLRDLFNSATGAMGRGIDMLKSKSADAFPRATASVLEAGSNVVDGAKITAGKVGEVTGNAVGKGLRGMAAMVPDFNPGSMEFGTASPANAARATLAPNMGFQAAPGTQPGMPGYGTFQAGASSAIPPGGAPPGGVPPGAAGAAGEAGGGGLRVASAAEQAASRAAMLRGAGIVAKAAFPVGSVLYGVGSAALGNTVEQQQDKTLGKDASPVLAGLRGAAAQAADMMYLGQGRKLGTAIGAGLAGLTDTSTGNRLANAWEMAKEGWRDARIAEERVDKGQPVAEPGTLDLRAWENRPAEEKPGAKGSTPSGAPAPAADDAKRGLRSDQVMTGRSSQDVDVLNGKVYRDDRSGPISIKEGLTRGAAGGRYTGRLDGLAGAAAGLGRIAAQNMRTNQQIALKKLENETTVAGSQAAKVAMEAGQHNRKNLEDVISKYAESTTPTGGMYDILPGSEARRKDAVSKRAAQIRSDIEFSLADSNRNIERMSNTEMQQLIQAHRLKEKWGEKTPPYFGPSFNSRNLYSYIPQSVTKNTTGGYTVHMGNGNKMDIEDVQGGTFRVFGHNDPIDSDFAAMLKPLMPKKGGK